MRNHWREESFGDAKRLGSPCFPYKKRGPFELPTHIDFQAEPKRKAAGISAWTSNKADDRCRWSSSLSGEQSQWHLQHTYWDSMTARLEMVRHLPLDAKTSSLWNSALSSSVQFFPRIPYHIPIISLTIQGYMRAEYDTEIGTAQICTVSTAEIVLNSTKPLTS